MQRALILAVLAGAAGAASAEVVAYWAFPGTVPAANANYIIGWPIAADVKANAGPATLDTDANKYDGSSAPTAVQQGAMQLLTGDVLNAVSPFTAGSGLGMRNLNITGGQQNLTEGKSIILTFDASNYQNMVLSFAERYSATGPTTVSVSVSSDGVNYTSAGSFATNRNSTFSVRSVDLSSFTSINNDSQIFAKITVTGYNTGSNGAARFDNIKVDGTLIPTPGALALAGAAGLMVARRRRK
ncbi:hypothetical protein LBMAG48_08500 [Phycisphaerae bacterium]|jgi:hypothetical protein|nr:hypothetical protein LBMAG48_08500 [Phycisphaerae bacterium]